MKVQLIFLFFFLFYFNSFGQLESYQKLSDKELILLSDLNNALGDSSTIVYPYISDNIDFCSADIKWLSNEFGFTFRQLSFKSADTISLKENAYFEVVESDSILKFRNKFSIKGKDGKLILQPFYYFLNQTYKKKTVRYFFRPIISKNGAFAIVEYDDVCGPLCASGQQLIMQSKKGKWRIIKVLVWKMS